MQPLNNYNPNHGSTAGEAACYTCLAGRYTDQAGSAECERCPAGYYLLDDATDTLLHDHRDDCTECPSGFYNPKPAYAKGECEVCASAIEPAAVACDNACDPGTYKRASDEACIACALGI